MLPLLSPSLWSLLSRVFVRSSLVCCPSLCLLASMARWISLGLLALSGVPLRSLVLLPVPILGFVLWILSSFFSLRFAVLVLVPLSLPSWSLSSRLSPSVLVLLPPPRVLGVALLVPCEVAVVGLLAVGFGPLLVVPADHRSFIPAYRPPCPLLAPGLPGVRCPPFGVVVFLVLGFGGVILRVLVVHCGASCTCALC